MVWVHKDLCGYLFQFVEYVAQPAAKTCTKIEIPHMPLLNRQYCQGEGMLELFYLLSASKTLLSTYHRHHCPIHIHLPTQWCRTWRWLSPSPSETAWPTSTRQSFPVGEHCSPCSEITWFSSPLSWSKCMQEVSHLHFCFLVEKNILNHTSVAFISSQILARTVTTEIRK